MFFELSSTYQTIFHPTFPFEYALTLDIVIAIFFCGIVALFLIILYHILTEFWQWFWEEIAGQEDLEEGTNAEGVSNSSQQIAFLQFMVQTNLQVLRMLETVMRDIEERRGNRQIAMAKLPPLVNYGSHDHAATSCAACTICLEDFESGEPCQVFPVCKHIFHSGCIHDWLKKKLTCPICRYCIKDK